LPDWVSRAFEMHRHFGIDIVMDLQRPGLVDTNIRELCRRFIEVQGMTHRYDAMNEIRETIFYCREFENWLAVEQYQQSGEKNYKETTYVNKGNIFACFNSFSCADAFLPPKGKDFSYLPSLEKAREEGISGGLYYRTAEPKEYRGK